MTHVLCLSCGSTYDDDHDCPRVDREPHSVELALRVANTLIELGVTNPTARHVHDALRRIARADRAKQDRDRKRLRQQAIDDATVALRETGEAWVTFGEPDGLAIHDARLVLETAARQLGVSVTVMHLRGSRLRARVQAT